LYRFSNVGHTGRTANNATEIRDTGIWDTISYMDLYGVRHLTIMRLLLQSSESSLFS